MTDQAAVQQWTNQYNQLTKNLKNINDAIKYYYDNGNANSPALYESQRLQLRLEYQINEKIKTAVDIGGSDLYETYRGQIIDAKINVPIDGILYNNIGQPLTWDSNATWGAYNEFQEVRNVARAIEDYIFATTLQNNKADITYAFSEWLDSKAGDARDKAAEGIFGSLGALPQGGGGGHGQIVGTSHA